MSSGGFSFCSSKSNSVVENIKKRELSNSKDRISDLKKNYQKIDSKVEPLAHQNLRVPGITSADQIHHYARNFIMVQR